MIICNWNIRGLNQAHKQKELNKFIFTNNIHVMGITETKVKFINQDIIQQALLPQWSFFSNCLPDLTGRIWVAWDPDKVSLDILVSNQQMIHTRITSCDHKISFEASFIYAFNTGAPRVLLWDSLKDLASAMGSTPWITLGDFNVTLHSAEIQGLDRGNESEREEFCKCLNDSCLIDLRYIGIFFTWCKIGRAHV